MDKIVCGSFTFERNPAATDNRLDGGDLLFANAIVSDELSIDTMEVSVFSTCRVPEGFTPSDYDESETENGRVFCCRTVENDIESIPYGTPVEFYRGDDLVAKLYKSSVVRDGSSAYRLTAVSAIGLLDKLPHSGGLYTGQTAGTLLSDIIGSTFTYSVDSDVANTTVFGWLPYSTRRDNLRQLLFAIGASVRKTADGGVHFAFLTDADPAEISNGRVYAGENTTFDTPATGVDVTEHAFYSTSNDTNVTLFSNSDGSGAVDHKKVVFDNPCHDLSATGLTINESGVNYAIVTGTGTLTGKEYTHQTNIVSRRVESSTEENIKTVSDATLVSAVNSGSVADRVLAYYSATKTISAGIVVGTERPGNAVTIEDIYGEGVDGLIKSMDITISSTLKANVEIIAGYSPTHGSDYSHYALLTGSGNWAVPAGVTKIKACIIGGGNGGSGGTAGSDGSKGSYTQYDPRDAWYTAGSSPGTGGDAGEKGLGGKIFADEITVTPGQSIAYSCGTGGAAGAAEGGSGGSGTDTTFGGYSSANGARNSYGCCNIYTGIVYGTDGIDGYDGGDGAEGVDTDPYEGVEIDVDPYDGLPGEDCLDGTQGGAGGFKERYQDGTPGEYNVGAACGGSGGGAAHGVAGGSGGNGTVTVGETSNGNTALTVRGGAGGNGATPLAGAAGASYGSGGSGGSGGGGGGCSGGAFGAKDWSGATCGVGQDAAGVGGSGSAGGAGANGCVLIYY